MSSTPVTVRNATDTSIKQTEPSKKFSTSPRLLVRSSATGNAHYTLVKFARPFPLTAVIVSAKFKLYSADAVEWPALSRTVTLKRITQEWKVGSLVYPGPSVTATGAVAVNKTSAIPQNTLWEFDVTAMMQLVADNTAWYGFRLEIDENVLRRFHSSQATAFKPVLEIVYTMPPDAPTTLSPAGNRAVVGSKPILRFDFTDRSGSTSINALQVQVNPTNVWTDPAFDTGTVLTSDQQLDLAATFPRTATVNTTNLSTTITAVSGTFAQADVGATIVGAGIPGGTTITAVASSTSATISAAATATGSPSVTITRSYAGLADGASTYWRVRVQDTAGVWSLWSDAAQFSRLSLGTLTITAPAASPNNFVFEASPAITWTFTVRTQSAWQVIILDANGEWLHTSGKLTSTATSYTVPAKIIHPLLTYTVVIRVWDTSNREQTPGVPAYVEASRSFTMSTSGAVTAVSGLTVTPAQPGVQLDFTRATAPDSFTVIRDDKVIAADLDPLDLLVSGTAYRYHDYGAAPSKQQEWEVRAVVGGAQSASTPVVETTDATTGIWLSDPERGISVRLLGKDPGTWAMGEDAENHFAMGSTAPVRITQGLRGYEGSISGTLATVDGVSVATATANMWLLKGSPGREYLLTLADLSFPVVIGNVVISPDPHPEIIKRVSFEFWQVADLPFLVVP